MSTTPSNSIDRADRKISAHATLETPPHRTNFLKSSPKSKHKDKIPEKPELEREKSDGDIKRRNKGINMNLKRGFMWISFSYEFE